MARDHKLVSAGKAGGIRFWLLVRFRRFGVRFSTGRFPLECVVHVLIHPVGLLNCHWGGRFLAVSMGKDTAWFLR